MVSLVFNDNQGDHVRRFLFRLLIVSLILLHIQLSFAAPMTGSFKGAVTLVEYYDYACLHCRRMEATIQRLQADYSNLRVVHRVTPILTPESRGIASVALAAQTQGCWQKIHQALMQLPAAPTLTMTENVVFRVCSEPYQIFKTMQQSIIQQQLSKNIQLAERHTVDGRIYLPILVLGKSNSQGEAFIVRGEQSYTLLSAMVKQLGDEHVQMAFSKKIPPARVRITKSSFYKKAD